MKYEISARGIELLKSFEGFRSQVYADSAGYLTIGYGHLIKQGEVFPLGVTEVQATELLKHDIADAVSVVNRAVKVPLAQNQFDALVSFTFNLGGESLLGSTLLKLLNDERQEEAAEQFLRWDKAGGKVIPGLEARRRKEKELFLACG